MFDGEKESASAFVAYLSVTELNEVLFRVLFFDVLCYSYSWFIGVRQQHDFTLIGQIIQ